MLVVLFNLCNVCTFDDESAIEIRHVVRAIHDLLLWVENFVSKLRHTKYVPGKNVCGGPRHVKSGVDTYCMVNGALNFEYLKLYLDHRNLHKGDKWDDMIVHETPELSERLCIWQTRAISLLCREEVGGRTKIIFQTSSIMSLEMYP